MDTQRSNRLVAYALAAILASALVTGCDSEASKTDTGESGSTPAAAQRNDADKATDTARDATPPPATKRDPADAAKTPRAKPDPAPKHQPPAAAASSVPQVDMSKLPVDARTRIEKALKRVSEAPSSIECITTLGQVYYGCGFPEAAAECFKSTADRLPRSMRHRYLEGLAYEAVGDKPKALAAYKQALTLDAAYPALCVNAAHLLLSEDAAAARALYQQAAVLDPKDALAHYGLGQCDREDGENAEALKHFRRSLEASPEFAAAHLAAAEILEGMGRAEEAKAHRQGHDKGGKVRITNDPIRSELTRVAKSDSDIAARALEWARNGERTRAVRYLQEARRQGRQGAAIRSALGVIYLQEHHHLEAYEHLAAARELEPDSLAIGSLLAITMVELGLLEDAEALFEKLLSEFPEDTATLRRYAVLLASKGERKTAEEMLRRVLELDPKDAVVHFRLGSLLASIGKVDDAVRSLRKSIEINARDARPHYALGHLLHDQGSVAKAVASWEQAVSVNPRFEKAYLALAIAATNEKRHAVAVKTLRGGLEHCGRSAQMTNALAWLLATCPDPAVRDGVAAVRWAERACSLAKPKTHAYVDTLAAAYAAAGQFAAATDAAQDAIKMAGSAPALEQYRRRLELYKEEKPYIETD